MFLTKVERDICRFVVRRFLHQNEVTSRQALLKEFKSSLADGLRKLVDRAVLRSVEQTYGNETYLPRATAFYYCGDSEALTLAQKSTETVLQVLLTLFEQELEKDPKDQKQLTPTDVEMEARKQDFLIDAKLTRIGLYFADEMSVFYMLQRDAQQIFPVAFRTGERIFEIMKRSNPWDFHVGQGRTSVERSPRDQGTSASFPITKAIEIPPVEYEMEIPTTKEDNGKIFLVHGHAEKVTQAISAFLKTLKLEVVILHEQPNRGRTVVEKFEKHSDVGFAVVLLTPDDIGAPIDTPDKTRKRARQNVILELGYFIGKLGRERVCPIYVEGVELPSDLHGVLWVPYDKSGEWRSKLTREIQAAGIKVNRGKT
jgi:hypothetical protein